MRKGHREWWSRLGRIERIFLALLVIYFLLRVTGISTVWQFLTGVAAIVFAVVSVVRLVRRGMRKAIWRLRNRLIVAYLFIAVVPIVLVVTLAALSGYILVGQVAAYFVRTELANRERNLLNHAVGLSNPARVWPGRGGRGGFTPGARAGFTPNGRGGFPPTDRGGLTANGRGTPQPRSGAYAANGGQMRVPRPEGQVSSPGGRSGTGAGSFQAPSGVRRFPAGGRFPGFGPAPAPAPFDPEARIGWFAGIVRQNFPGAEVLIVRAGKDPLRFPEESKLQSPPAEWGRASGLVLKDDGSGQKRLYMWAHVIPAGADVNPSNDVREVTIVWPVTSELLSQLDPRLDFVWIEDYTVPAKNARIPKAVNAVDLKVDGWYPLEVAGWADPSEHLQTGMFVSSRLSEVMGIIFESKPGQQSVSGMLQAVLLGVGALFLLVEIASLWAGVKLTRSITGAVHEIYAGTQHVKEGDFSYRIPEKGGDQLAEMSASFNTMTKNLGQLIVVAKEKERLQSELEIASEVQNQLFPRDIPSSKSLELKGVCKPARVVSGDYYDFMTLPGSELAFAIGDVAGKGISAALLMATIQSTMRTQLSGTNGSGPKHLSALGLVGQLNRQLYANTSPEKYATFFFALYDEDRRTLTYTNAGHLPPVLVRNGEFINLNPTGTVVGAFPFAKYEEREIQLEEGDILVAYTDGIVEPENPYGEMFGENRLKDLVLRYARSGSSEIIAHTMEAVMQWTGSSELQDDMTMVVARRI